MRKKWQVTGGCVLLIVITTLLAGCLDGNNNEGKEETIPQLDSVGPLFAQWEDWDGDGVDDGVRIGFYFMDEWGNKIVFEGVDVVTVVELYTQVNATVDLGEKGRLVYSEIFTVSSSQDVDPIHGGVLRIPEGDIDVDPETDYYLGILEVSVQVPQQGDFHLPPDNLIRLYD